MARMRPNEYAVAWLGGKYINDTTTVTGKFKGIFVPVTATIDTFKVNGGSDDVKADYFSGASYVITGPCVITARNRAYFSEIKLSAGQCYAIGEYSTADA